MTTKMSDELRQTMTDGRPQRTGDRRRRTDDNEGNGDRQVDDGRTDRQTDERQTATDEQTTDMPTTDSAA